MPLTRTPCWPEFGGQQPDLVGLVGLGGGVGDVVRAGEHAVLAGDVDDVAAQLLLDHHPGGLPGHQEGALGHHVVLQVPVLDGGLQQRLGQRQAGVVDHQVHPAERQARRRRTCRATAFSSDTSALTATATSRPPSSSATVWALSRFRSAMTTQPPSAAIRVAMALPIPEPAPVTSATRVASGLGLRHPLQLGLLQRPVLDGELLRLADRGVGGHRFRAAHHVDRVDVELAGDPGGLLVLAEGEHARPRGPARSPGPRPASPGESGVALRS